MMKLQQLIQDMCPYGVEFKKLGDLGVFENTGVDKKSHEDEQEVTLLNFMDVCRHKYIDASVPTMVVTAPDKKIVQCNVLKDDIFITPSSETIDEIGFAAVIMEDLPNVVYSYHIMRYRLKNPNTTTAKFIRYLFEAPIVRKQILKSAKGLTRFGLSKYQFADIEIPVPPLEIQKKIVECLDKFSALAAELQAELQMRRKQYEYYRTQLLTPHSDCNSADNTDDCNWVFKPFEEIFELRGGYTPSKNKPQFWEGGTIPWFRMEDIRTNGRVLSDALLYITPEAVKGKGLFEKDSFVLATSATIGEHALLAVDALTNQRFTNLKVRKQYKDLLYTQFIFHYMFKVDEFCKAHTNISGFESVDMDALRKMPFPLPPLAEQARIVSILDKFEALTTSLSDGIPAEQAAQQKRYEYYRDLLLTFDRKAV